MHAVLDILFSVPAFVVLACVASLAFEWKGDKRNMMESIADKLNAELVGGNCARCAEDMGRYADSLCDPLKERIAELLRCLENDWHIHASWDGLRKFWCIELTEEGVKLRDAACAERTCEIESSYLNDFTVKNMCWYEFEMKCGYKFTWDVMEPPKFCPNCGGKVTVVDA